jgi:hypothetical protein
MDANSSYGRYLATFAATTVALLAAIALMNWRVDPLQYYRRAAYPPEFSMQARYQNPGLARNYPYDTLIVGTSVSLGFDLRDFAAQTGSHPLNLAMSGSPVHEQRLLLDLALKTGRVKHVFWELNYEYFGGSADQVSDYDGTFPAYLYDNNPLTKVTNYLLNVDVTKASFRILLRLLLHKAPPLTLEQLTAPVETGESGAGALLKNWTNSHHTPWPPALHPEDFAPEKTRANFELNVLSVIRAHPEVTWDLWFPPHTTVYQTIMREQMPAAWEDLFPWKRMILSETESLPGVRLHDFQGDKEIVMQPGRYRDIVHFDLPTHELLVREMLAGREIATPDRLSETEAFLRGEAQASAVNTLLGHP